MPGLLCGDADAGLSDVRFTAQLLNSPCHLPKPKPRRGIVEWLLLSLLALLDVPVMKPGCFSSMFFTMLGSAQP